MTGRVERTGHMPGYRRLLHNENAYIVKFVTSDFGGRISCASIQKSLTRALPHDRHTT